MEIHEFPGQDNACLKSSVSDGLIAYPLGGVRFRTCVWRSTNLPATNYGAASVCIMYASLTRATKWFSDYSPTAAVCRMSCHALSGELLDKVINEELSFKRFRCAHIEMLYERLLSAVIIVGATMYHKSLSETWNAL